MNGTAHRVAELVATASGGVLTAAEAASGTSLRALGLGSLGFLRLVDALEAEYDVELDVVQLSVLDSVPRIAELVTAAGPVTP